MNESETGSGIQGARKTVVVGHLGEAWNTGWLRQRKEYRQRDRHAPVPQVVAERAARDVPVTVVAPRGAALLVQR